MSSDDNLTLRTVGALADLDPNAWDACARGGPPGEGRPYNPFLSHAFLHALEASGSATAETGWQPLHLALEAPDGTLLGAVPAYVKSHSQGEYIFDHAWADAFQRAGGRYYPKLLVAVPFTPASGPRLLARSGCGLDAEDVADALVRGLVEVTDRTGVSSVHVNFPTESEYRRMGGLGLLQRMDQQFHWLNANYGCFDDFLGELASKKRKNLKRERREALDNDITIEWVTGSDLREHHWDAFYDFYVDTGSRKWGRPYLTRSFFSLIGETMADDVLLIQDHRFLHFETCYYQAIDFAIDRGLKRVEAGAQGGHKVARGYLPCPTYSAHWIAHPGLREAVADYLDRERAWVAEDIDAIEERTPFSSRVNVADIRAAAEGRREDG
jgi:predicted N-acyltransferase